MYLGRTDRHRGTSRWFTKNPNHDRSPRRRSRDRAGLSFWSIVVLAAGVWGAAACSVQEGGDGNQGGSAGAGATADSGSGGASTGGSGGIGGGGTRDGAAGSGGSGVAGGSVDSGGVGGFLDSGAAGSGGALPESGIDNCPSDPNKTQPGLCGCGTPDTDTDGDLTPDCLDACPTDFLKTVPGTCGCGILDIDSDGDTVLDCRDTCPNDPMKTTAAGPCGCGVAEVDTDGDTVFDCLDGCPHDPLKTVAGPCGCLPDTLAPRCLGHRYTFDGAAGTVVAVDTIGGPAGNGTVVNTTLSGNGTVVLAGVASDQYVSLPARLISSLGNSATFEAWVTWTPVNASPWQRIFDFGNSDQGPTLQGTGQTYFFLSPRAGSNLFRVAITLASNGGEDLVDGVDSLPSTPATHVAVVIDGAARNMRLYEEGRIQPPGSTGVAIRPSTTLSNLNDVNNWLGRSQWGGDQEFAGTIHEFRIYSRALTAAEINTNAILGPDVVVTSDAGTGGNVDASTDAPRDVQSQ